MKNDTVKPLFIRDAKAIKLIHQKAKAERRSFANAAAHTIIEALSKIYGQQGNATDKVGKSQQ